MYVTSTIPVFAMQDREGKIEAHVRIQIDIEKKDSVNKLYHIKTADFLVFNEGTETESTTPYINRYGVGQTKDYYYSYEEYHQQKEILKMMYADELPQGVTESEMDDFLLKMGLIQNLTIDPILGLEGSQWK